MEQTLTPTRRNQGIELLRVAATFIIVVHHIVTQGGLLYEAAEDVNYLAYTVLYLLRSFTHWGSSAFALISGYLCIRSRYRLSSFFRIWLETVFYSLLITLIFAFAAPEQVDGGLVLESLFPVIHRWYWYITAYAALFLLIPLLNAAINALPRRTLTLLLLAGTALFCLLPPFTETDPFTLNSGYSPWWLAIMYTAGAYTRLYGEQRLARVKSRWLWLTLLLGGGISWMLHPLGLLLSRFPSLDWLRIWVEHRNTAFQVRNAITLAAVAVCIFLLFLRARPSPRWEKALQFLSAHSLGVYLIHVHPLLFNAAYYLFAPLAHWPLPLMLLGIGGSAALIFGVCTGLDSLRSALFRLLRADALAQRMADGLSRLGSKTADFIDKE